MPSVKTKFENPNDYYNDVIISSDQGEYYFNRINKNNKDSNAYHKLAKCFVDFHEKYDSNGAFLILERALYYSHMSYIINGDIYDILAEHTCVYLLYCFTKKFKKDHHSKFEKLLNVGLKLLESKIEYEFLGNTVENMIKNHIEYIERDCDEHRYDELFEFENNETKSKVIKDVNFIKKYENKYNNAMNQIVLPNQKIVLHKDNNISDSWFNINYPNFIISCINTLSLIYIFMHVIL